MPQTDPIRYWWCTDFPYYKGLVDLAGRDRQIRTILTYGQLQERLAEIEKNKSNRPDAILFGGLPGTETEECFSLLEKTKIPIIPFSHVPEINETLSNLARTKRVVLIDSLGNQPYELIRDPFKLLDLEQAIRKMRPIDEGQTGGRPEAPSGRI